VKRADRIGAALMASDNVLVAITASREKEELFTELNAPVA
jgi:hypothetical protein